MQPRPGSACCDDEVEARTEAEFPYGEGEDAVRRTFRYAGGGEEHALDLGRSVSVVVHVAEVERHRPMPVELHAGRSDAFYCPRRINHPPCRLRQCSNIGATSGSAEPTRDFGAVNPA